MNQINDLPSQDYNFGLEFNYGVWTPGTEVGLCNIPWNNDYRDVVRFDSRTALNTYIDDKIAEGVTLNELSYVKPNTPIRIPLPYNKVIGYNYLRASNPVQPIEGDRFKRYFYFITDVRYIAPNTTEIVIQLDVFQTFIYDVQFGNCYIERGHIGIANVNNFFNNGRDYLTVPEGLDIGNEYVINASNTASVDLYAENPNRSHSTAETNYSILAVSTVNLTADPGTIAEPKLTTAGGSSVHKIPSGASIYGWETTAKFKSWLNKMSSKPWVTQGILSVTVVPNLNRYETGSGQIYWPADDNPINIDQITETNVFKGISYTVKRQFGAVNEPWRDAAREFIPERYQHLNKFFTFPYMVIEWTNYTGNNLVLKPEFYGADHIVTETISLVPPNVKIAYVPRYNNEDYNVALWLNDLPKVPVVNNMAISYLSSNANTIAYQYSNADWSQQRALAGAQATYDNVTSGMNLANELTQIGINADIQGVGVTNSQMANQALIGVGQGLLGAATSGNPIGNLSNSLGGVLSTMNNQDANNQQLAIRNATANASNQASVGNTGFVRDTNKNLADWAARGDYAQAIAGINAKVQDAKMIQPSASGAFGGEAFMLAQGAMYSPNHIRLDIKIKMLTNATYRSIGEFWLRYGYAVQQFKKIPQNLKVMSKFTYWKLSETYITSGNMPETYKQSIRGILEKGVTVWSNPNDIGNIDTADNEPLEGIYL